MNLFTFPFYMIYWSVKLTFLCFFLMFSLMGRIFS